MKYRTSCDVCQDTKVRCSQSKPSCQRCTRKGLKCVYSPLRTVGRPRKNKIMTRDGSVQVMFPPLPDQSRHDGSNHGVGDVDMDDLPTAAATGQRRQAFSVLDTTTSLNHINALPSPPAPTCSASSRTSISEYLSNHSGPVTATTSSMSSLSSPVGRNLNGGQSSGIMPSLSCLTDSMTGETMLAQVEGTASGSAAAEDWLGSISIPMQQFQDFPMLTWLPEASLLQGGTGLHAWTSSNNAIPTENHDPTPPDPDHHGSNIAEAENDTGTGTGTGSGIGIGIGIGPGAQYALPTVDEDRDRNQLNITLDTAETNKTDCYVILLGRLAQVEEFLASVPPGHPPPIDFTLAAETDLQNLKERIFTCRSHDTTTTSTFTRFTDCTAPSTSSSSSCLSTPRPVFLVLSLLAERVIHLLEELFRHANALSNAGGDHAQFPPSTFGFYDLGATSSASSSSSLNPADSRRIRRTIRSLLDYSSTCPFPEANRPLHIGQFGVSDEVKTRALRRILGRRIKGLLAMLEDLKNGDARPKQHVQRTSTGTIAGAAEAGLGKSVEELYLRVESLLGRLDLTC